MPFSLALISALMFLQGPAQDLPEKYRVKAPAPTTVVARVNGVEIKASDVEDLLWQWRGLDALQDLISYEVVRAEAARQNLDVSPKQTETEIDQYLKQMQSQVPAGKTLDEALLEGGFTRSRLYYRFRTEDLLTKLVEASYKPDRMVKISTLVFRPADEQTSSLSDAIKKADATYKSLETGKKWDDVLAMNTSDPNVLKSKGLVGWRLMDVFPASVQKEMATLKPGAVTHPAQTENGIQIFRIEAVGKGANQTEQAEMKNAYMTASRRPLLDKIRKDSKIERLFPSPSGT